MSNTKFKARNGEGAQGFNSTITLFLNLGVDTQKFVFL